LAQISAGTAVRRVVFDTDVLIWYLRGNTAARRLLERVDYTDRAISSLGLMELIQGCRRQDEVREVKAFVAENFSVVLHPDEATSRSAIGLLEQHALAHGLRAVDAIIAASTLENGCALATGNVKHFEVISQLDLVPFRPGR
jgi:predicted nucleic acid-binding protein